MEIPYEETLRIERMSYGLEAIAHSEAGKTFFVEGGAPGDVVRVAIVEDKSTFCRAKVTEVIEAGESRITTPMCPLIGMCGGCPWGYLSYEMQLEAKRANVADALRRVGHFSESRVEQLVRPCVASKRSWGYRNKLELACEIDHKQGFLCGMHRQGTEEVVAVDVCPLANKRVQRLPKAVRGALRFLHGKNDLGIFRIGIRGAQNTPDLEIALWTKPDRFPRNEVASVLSATGKVTSIVRVLADPGSARKVKKVEMLAGKGHWEERMAGFRYLTSAPSFFQVNTQVAEEMVKEVLAGVGDVSEGTVADLYSGGGTFSIPLAKTGAYVMAVESSGPSVRDLRRNAEVNDVDVEVIGGDAARELPELGELDALVVDPPRVGLAKGVVQSIRDANPERVVYVSCDPMTLARDLAEFEQDGYVVQKVQPFDLFPQTYHVETVVLMARAKT